MRNALIVGINYYEYYNRLYGCVNDAQSVFELLGYNYNGESNFDCFLMTASEKSDAISRYRLKDEIERLFATQADIALFYFAGHGHIETAGGYLLASESKRGDEGVALSEILTFANASSVKNKIILLDSCHSGNVGDSKRNSKVAELSEGLTILTASTAEQYASEKNNQGVFTTLLIDALNGGAANLTGHVTPGSVYAHIDQSLSWREQRPVFKTNVQEFVSLRKCQAPIELDDLRRLPELFPDPDYEYPLDPTFEPEETGRKIGMPGPILENNEIFSVLQRYNRVNLVVPVGVSHMWNAAMESKPCRLTLLGKHYRRLAERKRI